jgi:hypothetical protein
MINPNASNIENAIILFGAIAPGFALHYLLLYLVMRMRHRRRRQPSNCHCSTLLVIFPARKGLSQFGRGIHRIHLWSDLRDSSRCIGRPRAKRKIGLPDGLCLRCAAGSLHSRPRAV